MKINALKEMVGAVVPEVTGEITKLWPVSNGVNNLGKPYSKQSGTLRDDTGEIDFTIWNRTELPQSLRGIEMTIKAGMGLKGGLRGLKVKKHYKDPSKIVLDIEDKATISDKENSIQEDAKDDIPMTFKKGSAEMNEAEFKEAIEKTWTGTNEKMAEVFSSTAHQVIRKAGEDYKPSKSPQERIAQFGKLYKLCWKESVSSWKELREVDSSFPTELIKDITTTFFIQSVREGLADKMEVKAEF